MLSLFLLYDIYLSNILSQLAVSEESKKQVILISLPHLKPMVFIPHYRGVWFATLELQFRARRIVHQMTVHPRLGVPSRQSYHICEGLRTEHLGNIRTIGLKRLLLQHCFPAKGVFSATAGDTPY